MLLWFSFYFFTFQVNWLGFCGVSAVFASISTLPFRFIQMGMSSKAWRANKLKHTSQYRPTFCHICVNMCLCMYVRGLLLSRINTKKKIKKTVEQRISSNNSVSGRRIATLLLWGSSHCVVERQQNQQQKVGSRRRERRLRWKRLRR